jgi:DNA primase
MRYPPEFLDQLRRGIRLSDLVARHVALKRNGRELVGLCPFHREKSPSFTVCNDKRFFHCFGCGAHGDAIGFVMRVDNVDFHAAVAALADSATVAPVPKLSRAGTDLGQHFDAHKLAGALRKARAIWDPAQPLPGTLADVFLAWRGLSLPPRLAAALRFVPGCEHPWTRTRQPAMVALIAGVDGEMIGLHRTYLRSDGRDKAEVEPQRAVLGRRKGGAVRLGTVNPKRELIVAEGIETTLSVMAAYEFEAPGWAALCAEGIESLQLPGEAKKLLIAADHDRNGVGERCARAASDRFRREGRGVRLWRPPEPGTDANDVLIGD